MLASQDKIDAALAKEHPGVTRERKETLVHHIRVCPAHKQSELHEILSQNLPAEELAFYNEIVAMPVPEETPVAAPALETPEEAVAAAPQHEGAASAASRAHRSRQ